MANVPAWVVLGLLSALFASLVAIFGKLGLQSLDATAATAARSVVMMAVLVVATLASGRLSALQGADGLAWTMILLSGLAGAASWLCYFIALQLGQAAPVAGLDRLSLVFTVFLAALILGEPLTPLRIGGAALVVVGVYCITAG
ncbi:MAG TPA: EamA family transporter [Chloroflexota bacterium]|nr:EamA family transporter [Chloroflexota bacterium]